MASFFEELRRRNVFKVGAAYAVVAWLLVQVADVALPAFELPNWILQAFLLVAALGLPVAIILAWVYDLTPRGIERTDDVSMPDPVTPLTGRKLGFAVAGLAILSVGFFVLANYFRLTGEPTSAPNSIAVLAFANRSPGTEDEYFATGLSDELLSVLGRLGELKVASRLSSFYFKGKAVDAETIASTLQVRHILDGTVRREGDRVRVTAELIDAQSGFQLWADSYDRDLSGILGIQAEIAASVAAAVVPILSPESQQRLTVQSTQDMEAYDNYLRGLASLRLPAEEATLAREGQLFRRATELDPEFAGAHAGLCQAHLRSYAFSRVTEEFDQAEAACDRALALDDSLWEVHVALGRLYRVAGQYDSGLEELRAALAQRSNSALPYLELGNIYWAQNRNELAEETFRQAIEVERGDWRAYGAFSTYLYEHGRYEESLEFDRTVIRLTPDSGSGYDNLGLTYWVLGDIERAEEAWRTSLDIVPSRWAYTNLGEMYYYEGRFAEAVEVQKSAIELAPDAYEAWGRLGNAYRFLAGSENLATPAFEEAIRRAEAQLGINPNDAEAVSWLSLCYAHIGQPDLTSQYMERMLSLEAENPLTHYVVALIHLRNGDLEATYTALERSVELGARGLLIANDPDLAALRGEARYEALLALGD